MQKHRKVKAKLGKIPGSSSDNSNGVHLNSKYSRFARCIGRRKFYCFYIAHFLLEDPDVEPFLRRYSAEDKVIPCKASGISKCKECTKEVSEMNCLLTAVNCSIHVDQSLKNPNR